MPVPGRPGQRRRAPEGRRLRLRAVGPVSFWGRPGPAPQTPSTPFSKYSSSNSQNAPPRALLTVLSSPGLHLPVTSRQPLLLSWSRTDGEGAGGAGPGCSAPREGPRGGSQRLAAAPTSSEDAPDGPGGRAGGSAAWGGAAPAPRRGPGSGETQEPGAPGATLLGALKDKLSRSPCHRAPAISAGDTAGPHGTWEPERPPKAPSVPRAPYVRLESSGQGFSS